MQNNSTTIGNLYIDTNILRNHPDQYFTDSRLADLSHIIKSLHIDIFIPQIVFDEYKIIYHNLVKGKIDALKGVAGKIEPYVSSKISFDVNKLKEELSEHLTNSFKRDNINIFDVPFEIFDIKELVNLAINKVKPFTDGDKGFKDTIILHSIINHCKNNINWQHLFLTSDKKDFNNVSAKSKIDSSGVKLEIFFSVDEITKYLNKFINEMGLTYMRERSINIKTFLVSNKETIFDYVKNERFSNSFYTKGLLGFPTLLEICSVNFIDIKHHFANYLEDSTDGDVDISFVVSLEYKLKVTRSYYTEGKYMVGDNVQNIETQTMSYSLSKEPEFVNTEKDVNVTGKIHISNKDAEEHYNNLRLEKVSEPTLRQTSLSEFFNTTY